jgi:tripartite-type tricarboxylate transporter receptor subunit TctC
MKKLTTMASFVSSLIMACTLTANAENFPAKPMNYILPFNAGGESDISARYQQAEWEKITGKPIIIQYLPGAGGAKAWSQLNSMEGDGYTIMGINLPHTVIQPLAGNVGYQTDDLTPVNYFHYTPNAIFVNSDSKFKTLQELVDYAKKNPGLVTFAGSGSNSANHLAAVEFDKLAGIKTTYIPFSGIGPSVTAIVGGQTTAGFNYAPSALQVGDKMRMLAVASEKRMPAFPDVPTFKELGYDLVGGAYRGLSVPKSTPEEVRKKISDFVSEINKQPEFIKKMEEGGFVLTDIPYEKMDEFVKSSKGKYVEGAKALGVIK